MSKNKKNFIIGLIGSGILFFMGILYLIIPNYYGIENMVDIDTNNLFLSFTLVFASVHFGKYYLIGPNPTNESIIMCIVSCVSGIINTILSYHLDSSIALSISVLVFTLLITAVKIFTVDYYHDKKDAYYYVEGMVTIMFFIVGIIMSVSLFNDSVIQTIELGFMFIINGMIDAISVATKCMLKAPRFLGKIKF